MFYVYAVSVHLLEYITSSPIDPQHGHTTATNRADITHSTYMDTIQNIIDEKREALGDGAYVKLCNAIKELHPLTRLYKVTYLEFYLFYEGEREDKPTVLWRRRTRIMPRQGSDGNMIPTCDWCYVFPRSQLPHDMSRLPMNEPFEQDGNQLVVTAVEPYLKRARDDESDGE